MQVYVEQTSAGEMPGGAGRGVEELAIVLELEAEVVAVVDLMPVEVLVLQGAECGCGSARGGGRRRPRRGAT